MQRRQAAPYFPLLRFIPSHLLLFILLLFCSQSSFAETTIKVPMEAGRWLSNGNATFTTGDHAADGVLEVSKGSVQVKELIFDDGVIEFDMYMPDHGILGMRLRAQNRENAEALYFRPQQDCNTSSDCMQYMPLEHGAFEWDLFPEYQTSAPIHTLSWNHFRVEVRGKRMQVYVNHASQPTLSVDRMEGSPRPGALIFGGPAKYANLVITPLGPVLPEKDEGPEPRDGFLRHWRISTAHALPSTLDTALNVPTGVQPPYSAMPPDGVAWRTITTGTKGLVNFSHEIGSAKDPALISMSWAKTTLISDKAQSKTVQIGWVREIWVYVNGKLVFSGRNLGDLPAAKVADQRISLENGTFLLPLHKGKNVIAIALDDNLPGNMQHFGWGMKLKLRDLTGIMPEPKN